MKTFLSLVIVLFALSPPVLAEQPIKGEVRDASGKLIYKTNTRGNVTETREPSGKLVTKSKTMNGTTHVRSPTGKLLYKSK
jgi:YD repeat-containing protein